MITHTLARVLLLFALTILSSLQTSFAQSDSQLEAARAASQLAHPPKIVLIYFGSRSCAECANWEGTQLPLLQQWDRFKNNVEFYKIAKQRISPVPGCTWWSTPTMPYCEAVLHYYDTRRIKKGGTPMSALLINNVVVDGGLGTRRLSKERIRRFLDVALAPAS